MFSSLPVFDWLVCLLPDDSCLSDSCPHCAVPPALGFTVHRLQPFGLLELVPKKDTLTGQAAKATGCCLFCTGAILPMARFSHIQSTAARIRMHRCSYHTVAETEVVWVQVPWTYVTSEENAPYRQAVVSSLLSLVHPLISHLLAQVQGSKHSAGCSQCILYCETGR